MPLIPRFHLFEINDQEWFPSYFRETVQACLTQVWITRIIPFQKRSPARHVADTLLANLATNVRDYIFIDFCSGAGGPTTMIEKHMNTALGASPPAALNGHGNGINGRAKAGTNGHTVNGTEAVQFVLTDLHPHEERWALAARNSPNLTYVRESVDAADLPEDLVTRFKVGGKKVFRLFNLAFHHFDDPLAKAILKNTVETSDGFAIFELQDRSFLGFLTCCLLGVGVLLSAPYYMLVWGQPLALIFTYLIPIVPFVLVVDGWVSALRTRTPDEVEALLRTCGAAGGQAELERWEVKSGKELFFWPIGYLHWIICVRR